MGKINVAVLMGGRSRERDISLSTGRMILEALDPRKYNAFAVDTASFGKALPPAKLALPAEGVEDSIVEAAALDSLAQQESPNPRPDIAFIALHGRFGEDGTVQGLLELLDIPYVGSGVLASALAIDKAMTRRLLQHEGIPVPKGFSIEVGEDRADLMSRVEREVGCPCIVKPNREGSSFGLKLVLKAQDLPQAVEAAFACDECVLIEEYVEGTEISVPVLGNDELQVLPVVEIIPAAGIYDHDSKYREGGAVHVVPAGIPEKLYARAQDYALACHRALGCRGMSRTDMIVRGKDILVLELNTIPGMTPTSLLPHSALEAGITFPDLLERLIAYGLEGR